MNIKFSLITIFILILLFPNSYSLKFDKLVEFKDSLIKLQDEVIDLGYFKENFKLRITIGLKLKNENELKKILFSGNVSLPLPISLLEKYLPTKEEYEKLINFVKEANPEKIITYKNRLILSFIANKINVEKLFNIKFNKYYFNNSMFYFSTVPKIKYEIAKIIKGISGLNNFSVFKDNLILTKPKFFSLDVYEVRKIYGIDKLIEKGITGKNQKIVIASAYNFNSNDIEKFAEVFNLPPTEIEIHHVIKVTDEIGDETTVDIQLARAIAPESKIVLAIIPDTKVSSFIELYNYIVSNDLGKIVSVSWLIPEELLSKDEIKTMHSIFMLAVAKGITIFVASGDWGSSKDPYERIKSKLIPFYPASDPFVVSVGGTKIVLRGGEIKEIAWGGINENGTFGSGGGYSKVFYRPSYQPSEVGNKRGYPDVALNSAPESGYIVYFNGKRRIGYGTSLAAPQWAGIYSLISQINNGTIGFLNYYLYKIYKSKNYTKIFNDIKEGNNGFYEAKEGWDNVTGLGTPKVDELANYLLTQSNNLLILANSSKKITINLNGKNEEAPISINFKKEKDFELEFPKIVYQTEKIRYIFIKVIGAIESSSLRINFELNKRDTLILLYKKQYLVEFISKYKVLEDQWIDANSLALFKVPKYVYLNENERAKFLRWTGDVDSTENQILIIVDSPKTLIIEWIIEYKIEVEKVYGIVLGEGWYKKGDKARLKVIDPFGFLKIFEFKGWKGDIENKSKEIIISVDKPYKLKIEWGLTFYGLLFIIFIFILIIFLIIIFILKIKKLSKIK